MRKELFFAAVFLLGAAPALAAKAGTLPNYSLVIDAHSPYTAKTAGQFAADCQKDEASCASIIGDVLMARIQFFSPTSHICLPDEDYAAPVPTWLQAHPAAASMSVEDGVFAALSEIYRCGPPNNY